MHTEDARKRETGCPREGAERMDFSSQEIGPGGDKECTYEEGSYV